MQIETKFKPGDYIFVLDGNRVHKRMITVVKTYSSIFPTNTPSSSLAPREVTTTIVNYEVKTYESDKDLKREYNEAQVFASKDELLKSL